MKPLSVLLLACLLTAALPLPAAAMPDLVILVRHAEKAADSNDPGLTPEGRERAKALKQALIGLNVNAILTSTARRTHDTAAPLAQHLHLQSQPVGGSGDAHVKAVADAVRAQTGVVLVVGHSNTVPAVIAALGGPKLAELCETSFHHAFLLQPAVPPATEPPRWAHFSYGAPSGAPQAGCL